MDIETSKKYVKADGYNIDESTIEILDEEHCIWLAYVSPSNDPNRSFPLLVRRTLSLHLTATALWSLQHDNEQEEKQEENDASPLELKYSDYDDTYISRYTEDEE